MAKVANRQQAFTQFTSLLESSGGKLRSAPAGNGRRVYKDVTIIKAGLGNQRDRNYYPFDVLEANVDRFDGLRAYADHPDSLSEEVQPERTVRDMVGIYTRPRAVREGQGGRVVADLHLFRSSKWLSDVVDDLIDLGQSDKIGLSINGRGRTVEKPLQLEEAGEPVNVNWVEEFLVLRSADVVTEAGAGGGFPQLLESARGGTAQEEKTMKRLTDQQKVAIKAATDANDLPKLSALMVECGCMDTKAAKVKPTEEAEDVHDADDEDEVAEADEPDALDAEADRIKEGTDEVEESDDTDDESEEDASEEEDDEVDTQEAKGSGMPKGAGKLFGGTSAGKHGNMIKGPKDTKGSMTKKAPAPKGQAGRRFGESDVDKLRRQRDKALEENAQLSAQLRVRTTTDRARNLLRESTIPEKMRPEILRLMVGKSEGDMAGIIRYHERMIESAIEEATSYVEGSGARFREASFGGDRGGKASITSALDGIPLK